MIKKTKAKGKQVKTEDIPQEQGEEESEVDDVEVDQEESEEEQVVMKRPAAKSVITDAPVELPREKKPPIENTFQSDAPSARDSKSVVEDPGTPTAVPTSPAVEPAPVAVEAETIPAEIVEPPADPPLKRMRSEVDTQWFHDLCWSKKLMSVMFLGILKVFWS